MASYYFRGEYAKHARELTTTVERRKYPLFNSAAQLFMVSALYGLLNNHYNETKQFDEAGVPPVEIREEFFNKAPYYRQFRITMIIMENQRSISDKEKIDNALRFDYKVEEGVTPDAMAEKSKYDENSAIIDGYALGGLEVLYEKYSDVSSEEEVIRVMITMKKDFDDNTGLMKQLKDNQNN